MQTDANFERFGGRCNMTLTKSREVAVLGERANLEQNMNCSFGCHEKELSLIHL